MSVLVNFIPAPNIILSENNNCIRSQSNRYDTVNTNHYTAHRNNGKLHIEFGANLNYTGAMGLYEQVYVYDNTTNLGSITDYYIEGYKIIDIIIDFDNNTISYYRDNVFYKTDNVTFISKEICLKCFIANGCTLYFNFGQHEFKYNYGDTYSLDYFYNNINSFLIKQHGVYYSIGESYYDIYNKTYTPLVLSGGLNPNSSDIQTYGFDSIGALELSNTIEQETFKPIDKLYDNFEIKEYKVK